MGELGFGDVAHGIAATILTTYYVVKRHDLTTKEIASEIAGHRIAFGLFFFCPSGSRGIFFVCEKVLQ